MGQLYELGQDGLVRRSCPEQVHLNRCMRILIDAMGAADLRGRLILNSVALHLQGHNDRDGVSTVCLVPLADGEVQR